VHRGCEAPYSFINQSIKEETKSVLNWGGVVVGGGVKGERVRGQPKDMRNEDLHTPCNEDS
jgi:hypothetical protein